jgi:hypothetical protein
MATMVQRLIPADTGDILLAAHSAQPPTQAEWSTYVSNCRQVLSHTTQVGGTARVLAMSDGGGPTAAQRAELKSVIAASKTASRTAVMHSNRMLRGIVTAVSWFNPGIKSFAIHEFDQAMVFLGVNDTELAVVRGMLAQMREELPVLDLWRVVQRLA